MDQLRANRFLVTAVLLLLGLQYVLGGLNWWIKLFPFPNVFDTPTGPGKHAVLDAMIETGWMFTAAKLIELFTGVALLVRRWVPLMLLMSFPVALTTFLIDAMIADDLALWFEGKVSGAFMWSRVMDLIFFGGAVLAMQAYLMFAYFPYFRPVLEARAGYFEQPEPELKGWTPNPAGGTATTLFTLLGFAALVLGILSTGWLVGMAREWLISWSSLAVTAPPS